jgi:hypothetical protein
VLTCHVTTCHRRMNTGSVLRLRRYSQFSWDHDVTVCATADALCKKFWTDLRLLASPEGSGTRRCVFMWAVCDVSKAPLLQASGSACTVTQYSMAGPLLVTISDANGSAAEPLCASMSCSLDLCQAEWIPEVVKRRITFRSTTDRVYDGGPIIL